MATERTHKTRLRNDLAAVLFINASILSTLALLHWIGP